MYGYTIKKCFDIGTPNDVVLRQSGPLCKHYGLITFMALGEVPLSYRIKNPGTDGTVSKQVFFGEDCRAFNAPQTQLGGGWKWSLIRNK